MVEVNMFWTFTCTVLSKIKEYSVTHDDTKKFYHLKFTYFIYHDYLLGKLVF